MKKYLVVFGLFIIILTGCSSNDEQALENDSGTQQEKQEESNSNETNGDDKSEEQNQVEKEKSEDLTIDVSAFEMGYDPDKITLEVGKEYELVLTNEGQIFHDLTESELDVEITYMSEMAEHSDEQSFLDTFFSFQKVYADEGHGDKKDDGMKSIHMNANAGQTVSIKFIPKEAGEFEFYCTVPGHKEAGMVGKFIVKE
ncbi:cupredoxin domain-containing protein [Chengkuizengella sediminis]|uniref:cupredoxin domain-containing protein n=1 Tax=Chengkuizengella sediminis TaxID=1885917 RepID=UPI001389F102|nr:plastocyanin/azurin family copper-binding protein [Chengkuizengella sediminis]NDI35245.1 multicopper oxidase domain-containing protein [Chengkuizengella sediminis]